MSFNTFPQNPFPPNSENAGGGGLPYVLPIASAETLGGVKVGNNLTIDANGVLSAPPPVPSYSATEQATGQKWIDGKVIYFKTVEIDNPVSTGTPTSVAHGADADKIVKIDGYAEIDGVFVPVTYYASSNYYAMVYASISAVVYDVKWNNAQFTKLVVTIYYTKVESEV